MVRATSHLAMCVWLASAGALLVLGGWLLMAALPQAAAAPVPVFITMDVQLPHETYVEAARRLSGAAPWDGQSQLALAEARLLAYGPDEAVHQAILRGLVAAPASPRGWSLLADWRARRKMDGAPALAMALTLAPFDTYDSARRMRLAAVAWPSLDAQRREIATRLLRASWLRDDMRPWLPGLMAGYGAPFLFGRAFADHPADLRAFNRWLILRRLRAARA